MSRHIPGIVSVVCEAERVGPPPRRRVLVVGFVEPPPLVGSGTSSGS